MWHLYRIQIEIPVLPKLDYSLELKSSQMSWLTWTLTYCYAVLLCGYYIIMRFLGWKSLFPSCGLIKKVQDSLSPDVTRKTRIQRQDSQSPVNVKHYLFYIVLPHYTVWEESFAYEPYFTVTELCVFHTSLPFEK